MWIFAKKIPQFVIFELIIISTGIVTTRGCWWWRPGWGWGRGTSSSNLLSWSAPHGSQFSSWFHHRYQNLHRDLSPFWRKPWLLVWLGREVCHLKIFGSDQLSRKGKRSFCVEQSRIKQSFWNWISIRYSERMMSDECIKGRARGTFISVQRRTKLQIFSSLVPKAVEWMIIEYLASWTASYVDTEMVRSNYCTKPDTCYTFMLNTSWRS